MIVYVAAPFSRYKEAYRAECTLREAGLIPDELLYRLSTSSTDGLLYRLSSSSRWIGHAMRARGDDLSATLAEMVQGIRENDEDLARCDLLLALAYPNEGGEMFAEVARALHLGKPVAWVGQRLILSCLRKGMTIYPSVEAVTDALRLR